MDDFGELLIAKDLNTSPEENEYDQQIRNRRASEAAALRGAFEEANKTTPEAAAETAGLAERSGLPEEVVERNKERLKLYDAVDKNDYGNLLIKSPVLAKHFQNHSY